MIDALIIDCSTNEGPLLLVTLRIICSWLGVWCVLWMLVWALKYTILCHCSVRMSHAFFVVVVTPKRAGLNGAF